MPSPSAPCPWEHIEPDGSNLTIEDFLSVHIVRIATHLKRVPVPYTKGIGLTLPQWRLLSALAHHQSMPMKELAKASATDRALVSRTVKELLEQKLLCTASMNAGDRSLTCSITPKGEKLVNTAMPLARMLHARILLSLDTEDRVKLYEILQKLQATLCADENEEETRSA